MDKLPALGLVILISTASCVPPRTTTGTASVPPVAAVASHPAVLARAVVMPAGPEPLFLKPPTMPLGGETPAPADVPAFVSTAQGDDARRALDCLTAAIYYEARSESVDGQRAVAQVVLNRVRNPAFPNSICGVVYQGSKRGDGCQFTFTCDGSLLFRREPAAWVRAGEVAQEALSGHVYAPVGAATYYHTTAVSPWWAPSLVRVATIGAHIFYRWGHAWGEALDFRQRYAGLEPTTDAASEALPVVVHYATASDIPSVTVHRGSETLADTGGEEARFGVHVHFGSGAETSTAPGAADASVKGPAI